MHKKIILLFLLFTFAKAQAQKTNCEPSLPYSISAESGLKMRSGPSTNDPVVVFVPGKSRLLVCEELATPQTIENIAGHWRKVKYKEKYGYMFDGFLTPIVQEPAISVSDFKLAQLIVINKILTQDLSKLDSVIQFLTVVAKDNGYEKLVGRPLPDRDSLFVADVADEKDDVVEEEKVPEAEVLPPPLDFKFIRETYNYCGDITTLDPGKIWYGIYRDGNQFLRKRINLLVIRSKYSLGSGIEFDLKAEEEIHPTFMISSSKLLPENLHVTQEVDFFVERPYKLYPGQIVEVYANDPKSDIHNVSIFATGNVTDVGICPEMTDYKIKVTGEMHDALITQDLTPLFEDLGDCGIPDIFWFGDINGDLYPDIVFVSTGEQGMAFTFFVSDTQNKKTLYRKADQWFNYNCD